MKVPEITSFFVPPSGSIREAAICINQNRRGIALVVDEAGRLLLTITDGDIRRALLAGAHLDEPLTRLQAGREKEPVTAPEGTPVEQAVALMRRESVRQVPLVDGEGRVRGLLTLDDLVPPEPEPMEALIMAGGHGKRLRPHTQSTPKPMLRIGDRPLMEHIIDALRDAGIRRVNIATHYRPEAISGHFGDGSAFGVEVSYVNEDQPLGTAGALGLLEAPGDPLLVINGDILTEVDFRAMHAFHRDQKSDLTVAVRQYDLQVPFGVLECRGAEVRAILEKPRQSFLVNAGIYLLGSAVHALIPPGERLDMPELIDRLLAAGRRVVSFPVVEYWLDVGQPGDFERAELDYRDRRRDTPETRGG